MKTVLAVSLYRSIRRRIFAHVVLATDGHYYWVKQPHPELCEGRAALGAQIVRACGVDSVEPARVVFDKEFVARSVQRTDPDFDGYASSICEGIFFGTKVPVDPTRAAFYDLLPLHLRSQVQNALDFSTMRAVDCWTANVNPGRAIFVRHSERGWVAHMLGFSKFFSFDEPEPQLNFYHWCFAPWDSPESWENAFGTADTIRGWSKSSLEELARDIPPDWWRNSSLSAAQIIATLLERKSKLDNMLLEVWRHDVAATMRKSVHRENGVGTAASRQSA